MKVSAAGEMTKTAMMMMMMMMQVRLAQVIPLQVNKSRWAADVASFLVFPRSILLLFFLFITFLLFKIFFHLSRWVYPGVRSFTSSSMESERWNGQVRILNQLLIINFSISYNLPVVIYL